ncbi:MAG: hypothetical protein Q9174_006092 [Haloplaca sp. 1 TL-2023]
MLLARASLDVTGQAMIDRILDPTNAGNDVSTDDQLRSKVLDQCSRIEALEPHLAQVSNEQWGRFCSEELAENYVPAIWDEKTTETDRRLRSVLLVKLFRVDRFVPAVEKLVTAVFSADFFDTVEELEGIVAQVESTTPIALASNPGFDASYKVNNLVDKVKTRCSNIAMGSNEGPRSADKALSEAAATGQWVLVKNVHLAPGWLQGLEKRLGSLKPHADFRLFLSMETSPKIPVNLLRTSRILMYEQPAGVRANMRDSLATLTPRASKGPVEKGRLYLLLSFLHAVVQERLRYAPTLGWKGFWEFNDSDVSLPSSAVESVSLTIVQYACAAFIIDTWMETIAHGRTNIAPVKMPWELLRTLVTETYGGKIDSEEDFEQLRRIVHQCLTPAAFEDGHKLVEGAKGEEAEVYSEGDGGLTVPEGTTMPDFMKWVNGLPEREPPTYLGLPANAEKLLLVGHGRDTMKNVARVTEILGEGEESNGEER